MRQCAVFMPMLPGYEGIRAAVAEGIRAGGTGMLRLEELLADADWQHWLVRTLARASVVLADLTDHNPFVMYELGLAHARGIPALLIVDSRTETVTPTVLGTPFLPYSVDHLPVFAEELAAALVEPKARPEITDPFGYARELAAAFAAETGLTVDTVSPTEFATRLAVAADRGDPCRTELALLARIVRSAGDVRLMRSLWTWSARSAAAPG